MSSERLFPMESCLLRNGPRTELPPKLRAIDVRSPESLVDAFLREYTREGDTVLDPFAGFGTTLLVAEAMGRAPAGIEYDRARYGSTRDRLKDRECFFTAMPGS